MTTESNEEQELIPKDSALKMQFKSQFFDFQQTGYENETDFDISRQYLKSELSDKTQIFNRIFQQSFLQAINVYYKIQFRWSFRIFSFIKDNWKKITQIKKKQDQRNPKNMTKLFLKMFYVLDKKQRSKRSWSMIKIINFTKNNQMKNYQAPITKGIHFLVQTFESLDTKYFQNQLIREAFKKITNLQSDNERCQILQKFTDKLIKWEKYLKVYSFQQKMQAYKNSEQKIQIFIGTLSLLVYPLLRFLFRHLILNNQTVKKKQTRDYKQVLQHQFLQKAHYEQKNKQKLSIENQKPFETEACLNLDSSSKYDQSCRQNIYCKEMLDKRYLLPKKSFLSQDSNTQDQNLEQNQSVYRQFQQKVQEDLQADSLKTVKFVRNANKLILSKSNISQIKQDQTKLKFKFKKVFNKNKTKLLNTDNKIQDQSNVSIYQKNVESDFYAQRINYISIKPSSALNFFSLKTQNIKLRKQQSLNQQLNTFLLRQKMKILKQLKSEELKQQISELTDNYIDFSIRLPFISRSKSQVKSKTQVRSFNKIPNINKINKNCQPQYSNIVSNIPGNSASGNQFNPSPAHQYLNLNRYSKELLNSPKITLQNAYESRHLTSFHIQDSRYSNGNSPCKITDKNQYYCNNVNMNASKSKPSQVNQYFFPISSELLRSKSSSQFKFCTQPPSTRFDVYKNLFVNEQKTDNQSQEYYKNFDYKSAKNAKQIFIQKETQYEDKKMDQAPRAEQLMFKTKRPRRQISRSAQKVQLVSNYYISGQKYAKIQIPRSDYYYQGYGSKIDKQPIYKSNKKLISQLHDAAQLRSRSPGPFNIVKSVKTLYTG